MSRDIRNSSKINIDILFIIYISITYTHVNIQLQMQIPKTRQRLLSRDCIWKPWVWKIQMSQNRTKKQNANLFLLLSLSDFLHMERYCIALPPRIHLSYRTHHTDRKQCN